MRLPLLRAALAAFSLVLPGGLRAASPGQPSMTSSSAPAQEALPPMKANSHGLSLTADRLIFEGMDALYGLDFDVADAKFTEVDRLQPGHPAGPFFLAGRYWVAFSQDADLPGTKAALEPRFNSCIDKAFARARAMHDKGPNDPVANYYLGVIYGMRGRWQLLNRQWLRAGMNGYKGYKYLKKTVELDPTYYDAYLGLGMYDYYSDTLPRVLKLASFLFERGDRKRGLEEVRAVIDKGHHNVIEAKIFLIALYTGYEHTPEKAFPLIHELRSQYPDNALFTQLEVVARVDAKDWDGAIAFAEMLAPKVRALSYTRSHVSIFDVYRAEAYMGKKEYDRALAVLDGCVEQAPDPRKASVTYCYLRRAQTLDLMGRREQALKDYKTVRQRDDYWDSQDKAKKRLKAPITYDQLVEEMLE